MFFTLCLLQEQQAPLYVAFIDLQKAFDTVSRNSIHKDLSKTGCPKKVLSLFKEFHEEMKATVQYENETSSELNIDTSMKPSCVLAPINFTTFSILPMYVFENNHSGVLTELRMDSSFFNIRRFQSKRHVTQLTMQDLLFANGAEFISNSPDELQIVMNKFSDVYIKFGMTISIRTISIKKTVVMSQGTNIPPKIYVNKEALDSTDHFCYFSSTLTSSLSLDKELDMRISKASVTFGKLTSHVWNKKLLTLSTEVSIYQACVLSTLF
ncbi:hypothetical protein Y1Q_0014471 [Alligator mississippiensis]|uniref:Uncharacterized protein n=1 Tax=Alligator mississippiensis TaxID=8496 RepID=A0A151PD91_ALLMI|nr:hypothetical protein Y1Q_0014471 [Alligator mississippiensis]